MTTATPRVPARPAAEDAVCRALTTGMPPARAGAASTVLTFGWRGMLKVKHVPEQLIDVTVTPVLLVFLFTYMFGGAIAGSAGDYLQFLLPGMLVMSLLFSTVYSGVALVVVFAFGLSWAFAAVGLLMRAPNAVSSAGSMALFPLVFLSNVFVERRRCRAGSRRSSTSARSLLSSP